MRGVLIDADAAFSSPALRARQTAEAAGLSADRDPDLAECDFGCWTTLTLGEVHARDPEGLRAWFEDPHAAPHGGESQAQMAERVRRFLEHVDQGTTVAVTHGGVVKVAMIQILGAPYSSFWRIDVAPASITELRRRDGTWTVARTNWTVG
ncbi:MAG: histidine phosphatase family protein [Myxococcota bacterium]